MTTLRLKSSLQGAAQPFAVGHAFRQGDVPSGMVVLGDCVDWQCSPISNWPDGSLKHALLSGKPAMAGSADTVISLWAGQATSQPALTEADLAAVLPTVDVTVGSHTSRLNTLVGTGARHRTVCAGPTMSNWIYRQAVSSSNHLVVWLDVRLYKGGTVEVFPWVENAHLLVANASNSVQSCAVVIGGATRFSQTIDIKHHTRVPLINTSNGQGSDLSFSHWIGTDPRIVPQHNVTYLKATRLVPNYGYAAPSTATLEALNRSFAPNSTHGITSYGSGGSSAAMLGHTSFKGEVLFCLSGDTRAYLSSLAFGLSGGSWSLHYRDETHGHEPIRFSTYPNISIAASSSPVLPTNSGGENTSLSGFSHWPSYGYLPFLLTGRWFFLDEVLFWLTYRYIWFNSAYRENSAGIAYGATRQKAWYLRDLAYGLSLMPEGHPCREDFRSSWEANISLFHDRVVTGTRDGGKYKDNALGVIDLGPAQYNNYQSQGNNAWATPWQISYLTSVIGHSWNLGLYQSSASLARHRAVRDFAYKHPVGLAGDGTATQWNWRRADYYVLPYGTGATTVDGSNWTSMHASWGLAYSELVARMPAMSIANTPSNAPLVDLTGATLNSSSLYLGDHVNSLALAVEHGAPGAAAAYARLMGASNSNIITNLFNDFYSQAAIVPR